MKKQKIHKKLDLNKNTIANLAQEDMDGAKGGTLPPTVTYLYPSYCKPCSDVYSECIIC